MKPSSIRIATVSATVRGFAQIEPDPARHRALAAPFAGLVTARHAGAGDTVAARQAAPQAVRMLLSGPAGGLVAAAIVGWLCHGFQTAHRRDSLGGEFMTLCPLSLHP